MRDPASPLKTKTTTGIGILFSFIKTALAWYIGSYKKLLHKNNIIYNRSKIIFIIIIHCMQLV